MIELLHPSIFKHSDILAAFTTANKHFHYKEGTIQGLNIGFNTTDHSSVIEENLRHLSDSLQINQQNIALAKQVHGDTITTVSKGGTYKNTDGLVTIANGLFVGIQVADCAAVLLADPENRVAGAFHAGWRGAAADIIKKGIDHCKELGGDPENMLAYVSPCISQKKFEVGPEVAEQFPEEFVDNTSYKKPHVDLKGFIKSQLIESGIPKEQIEISDECTISNQKFYSFRRERENAGRMLGVIGFKK